jgi:hypothetical protein
MWRTESLAEEGEREVESEGGGDGEEAFSLRHQRRYVTAYSGVEIGVVV